MRVVLSVVAAMVLLLSAPALWAQASVETLPVMVDGSQHPELIPDEVAYRHFLLGIAFPANPTEQEKSHRYAKLRRLGLSSADQDALVSAVAGLRETVNALVANGNSEDAASVQKKLIDAVGQSKLKLVNLSAGGRAQLDSFIQNTFKRRMTIYGGPM